MASRMTAGEWPRQFTAQPCTKSRYFLPSRSQSHDPLPSTMTSGGRSATFMICRRSLLMLWPPVCSRRRRTVWVALDLHQPLGMARFAEAILAVEPMGISREEDPAPEALKIRMRLDGRHELLAHAASPMRVQHEDVADIGEGRMIRDHPGKAHLPLPVEGAETGRMTERAGHQLAGDTGRPVGGPREKPMDGVEVEP